MKSLDRMITALNKRIPDRVPVIMFTHISALNLGKDLASYILAHADAQFEFPIKEFLYSGAPVVGTDLSCEQTITDDGWIKRTFTSSNGISCSDQFHFSEGNTYRSYKKHLFDDIDMIDTILSLPYKKPENNTRFREEIRQFCAIQDAHNTEHEFCAIIINNPLSFLAANSDPTDMSLWTILERDTVRRYLTEMTRRISEYADYMLSNAKLNCIFIMGGSEYGIPPLMSPKDFYEFVFQHDRPIIDVLHRHGKKVLIHCHGKIATLLPYFIDMGGDGIHPLEPVGPTGDCDLRTIKKRYGKDICLVGNIQYEDFYHCTQNEMERIVLDQMAAAKDAGGFILSPACPMFFDESSAENVRKNIYAFIDAGIKYGIYK